jgi:hypothetical protein
MKLPKGVTVHLGNKKFVGEIPDSYVEKYKLDFGSQKSVKREPKKEADK